MTRGLSAARAGRYVRAGGRWAKLIIRPKRGPGIRVFYGHDRIPSPGEAVSGGTQKFQRLSERFPNRPTDFNLLYLGSSSLPRDLRGLLWLVRRRDVPVVVNQNGVAFPAWAGGRVEEINRPLRSALLAADHVFYLSAFCKQAGDEFLGEPRGSWEVLHHAVDIDRFTPSEHPPAGGPVLLLSGDQLFSHRLELAFRTLKALSADYPDARLLVSGRLAVAFEPLLDELDLRKRVDLVGRYSQQDAPALYRRAHLLLHTQVNDAGPSTVIEAMSCGLPVVHPASGGTVELVGDEAGIGVPHPGGWERYQPPAPEEMAASVARVLGDLDSYRKNARRRAVERFALPQWLARHEALFEKLTAARCV
jgi:glycosyltransferase involved in cell wall biosynthesis